MSLDRYRVGAPLVDGSDVHRAFDTRLQRDVALRLVDDERAIREARAAAALRHPNIVIIYDVGDTYVAMELVDGVPLRDRSDSPLARKLGWLRDVARALVAAHAAGIVHRDLDPSHVIVTRADVAKLLGLGSHEPSDDARADDQRAWGTIAVQLIVGRRIDEPGLAEKELVDAGVDYTLAKMIAGALEARLPSFTAIVDALDAAGVESVVVALEAPPPETRPTVPLRPADATLPSENLAGERTSSPPRKVALSRRWLIAGGVAAVGAIGGGIAYRMHGGAASLPPSCTVGGEIAIHDAIVAPDPIEVVVCEGQITITMDATDKVSARGGSGPIDGPIAMASVPLEVPMKFARPLCRERGGTTFVAWGTLNSRFKTSYYLGPPVMDHGESWTDETHWPAPCSASVHPGGVTFLACEEADPNDPRIAFHFQALEPVSGGLRDLGDNGAKPHGIATAYPFTDRPIVVYRAGERLAAFFPSPFESPNEARVELARGTLGDPEVAGVSDHAVVAWAQQDGDGFVLRASSVTQGAEPQRLAIGDPPSSSDRPALAVIPEGIFIAWTDASGGLHLGFGIDVVDAVARSQVIASHASHPRIAARGRLAATSWREPDGKAHLVSLDCRIR